MGDGSIRPPEDIGGLVRMMRGRPMPWDGSLALDYLLPALKAGPDGSAPGLDAFLAVLAAACGDGSGAMDPGLASADRDNWSSLGILLRSSDARRSRNAAAAGGALAAALAAGLPSDPAARSEGWSAADALGREPTMAELVSGGLPELFAAAPWPTARAVAGLERRAGSLLESALPGIDPGLAAEARRRRKRTDGLYEGLDHPRSGSESC